MSQGHTSVIRALGTVWMILSASAAVAAQTMNAAQQNPPTPVCRPAGNITENEALVKGGYVGSDGKVYFTFGFEPDADPIQQKVFSKAVDQWNDLSHVTGIVLKHVTFVSSADIKF